MPRRHLDHRDACPSLPGVKRVWTARDMAPFRGRYDAGFYEAALHYAQSLWLEGKPAQALLQLNKSMMAERPAAGEGTGRPLPYAALAWVLRRAPAGEFLGNPVRHYQHLATRMSGPRGDLRRWRAWACLHLAETILPADRFPRDHLQVERERIRVPDWAEVLGALAHMGWPGEEALVREVREGERAAGLRPD
ncbi:MAG: hypothetical protein HKN82_15990 [Akkermansiaceae bacterium]|nr:hypothetical protein [Akkermansiaceae bacterium]NNM29676.1 hypothetical protein [Akkermansiaceae bacterium]